MDKQRALYLIRRYREHLITEEELQELRQWMQEQKESPLLKEAIEEDLLSNSAPETIGAERLERMFQKVVHADKIRKKAPVRSIWIRWAAAACIILAVGYRLWVMSGSKPPRQQGSEVTTIHDVPAPSNSRAVITLANGQKVYLDSVNNGTIAQENNVRVVKNSNGAIVYQGSGDSDQGKANSPFNTLFNPRGSKVISLTLSDGTKVWLNSASSLRYPASFAPSSINREVEITGEAYFEVAHNSKQPFKVHLPNGSVIEDIGTSFNVNAYADEATIKTTLLEGSIKVSASPVSSGVTLKPGEQAIFKQANPKITPMEVQTNVDLDQVMAWKNGYFQFSRASLQDVMKQISRWYDVDIHYEGTIPSRQFGGRISRNMNVSQVLKILEESEVHFRIEGKKIIVMP